MFTVTGRNALVVARGTFVKLKPRGLRLTIGLPKLMLTDEKFVATVFCEFVDVTVAVLVIYPPWLLFTDTDRVMTSRSSEFITGKLTVTLFPVTLQTPEPVDVQPERLSAGSRLSPTLTDAKALSVLFDTTIEYVKL